MSLFSPQAHSIKSLSAEIKTHDEHTWLVISLVDGWGEAGNVTLFAHDADAADRFRKLAHYINLAFSHSAPSTAPELFEAVKLELVK